MTPWTAVAAVVSALVALPLACAAYQVLGERKDRTRYPMPGQAIDVGGHRLHVQRMGDAGPTIVFDSGIGGSSIEWSAIQQEVAKFARVITYDRAGYGYSEDGPGPRNSDRTVEELHTLLNKANIPGPYILVGHSFGGLNARIFAHRYPQEVAGLVLVDATHEDELTERFPKEHREAWYEGVKGTKAFSSLAAFGLPRMMAKSGLLPDEMKAALAKLSPEVRAKILAFYFNPRHLRTLYQEMAAMEASYAIARQTGPFGDLPLIVIRHGRPDKTDPRTPSEVTERIEQGLAELAESMAGLSTRGKVVVAEQSGHAVHYDQPDLIVSAIRDMVEATPRTSLVP